MNAPPLLFGGKSPVVAYLRHSMMVCHSVSGGPDGNDGFQSYRLS